MMKLDENYPCQNKEQLLKGENEIMACWWNISELATAMIQPTRVRDLGQAIVVDIVSFIAGMLAASTIRAWK